MQNRAILYFSLAPYQDAQRKRWTRSSLTNVALFKALYGKTRRLLNSSGLDIIETDGTGQKLGSFGNNLSRAIQSCFDQGYEELIIIGNDCPTLSLTEIHQASTNLDHSTQTIGKTTKGGTYLFTISKESWSPIAFQELPWCTDMLGNELTRYLKAHSRVTILNTKDDLNTIEDVFRYISRYRSRLANIFKSLLHIGRLQLSGVSILKNTTRVNYPYRGPPTYLKL